MRQLSLSLSPHHNWQLSKQKQLQFGPIDCALRCSLVCVYNFTGYFDASSLIMQPDGLRLINNVLHSLLPVRWSVINQRLLCKRNAVPPGNGSAPQYATRATTTAK